MLLTNDGWAAAARLLAAARLEHRPLAGLPEAHRPALLVDAYRLQAKLAERLTAALGPVVGWKIGCTTAVMQDYLEIPHPCAGAMFASSVQRQDGVYARERLVRPGVECEIAVAIGRDLPADRDVTAAEAGTFVAAAMASIELVDDRWRDFREVGTPTLVADNFFNAGCVLGAQVSLDPARLKDLVGTITVNGDVVGTGGGPDILGDPLEALAWLANHRGALGVPLGAGDVVTLGSIVQTIWIDTGDEVAIEIDELGGCRLQLR